MHNWDLSSSLNAGMSVGGTMMSIQQEQLQNLWAKNNNDQSKIKSEPIESQIGSELNPNQTPPQIAMRNTSPLLSTQSAMDQLLDQIPSSFRQLGVFNPLTPPGYSGLIFSPLLNNHHNQTLKQLTPSKIQNFMKLSNNTNEEVNDNGSLISSSLTPPMDVTPPKSPKDNSINEQTPEKDENLLNGIDGHSESLESYDEDSDDFGDDEMHFSTDKSKNKLKRKSSNGKPKQYKCKQCKLICVSKTEFWDHTRSHIKPEKMLQCPKCPFVTEYKHHLEYHLRNHSRSKPFQCPKCNYSCVNKSMLNSHLKSHSNVFQYRCADCNYATKYCHSLKLHLRKYTHKPDIVLNLDGTPNPLPIIDVYGTRRGPKSKSTTSKLLEEISRNSSVQKSQLSPPLTPSTSTTTASNSVTQHANNNQTPVTSSSNLLPNALMANMLQNVGSNISLFPYLNLNFQMLAAHQKQQQQHHQQQQQHNKQNFQAENENSKNNLYSNDYDSNFANDKNSPINETDIGDDLSNLDSDDINMDNEHSNIPKASMSPSCKSNRRKGQAFKLEENNLHDIDQDDENSSNTQPIQSPVSSNNGNNRITTTSGNMFECKFCGILFKDNILYTIHMGYHGYNDVFKCNSCGEKCDDHVQFFLHIAKYPHS